MKKIAIIIFVLGIANFSFSQNIQNKNQTSIVTKVSGPVIKWDTNTHDFGEIVQGEKVEYVFRFTNAGNEPLVITNIEVTCGCTTPKGWVRDPINPGQSGEIIIAFNSAGKIGVQNKVSTVVSNAINSDGKQISFKANVIEKKNPQ